MESLIIFISTFVILAFLVIFVLWVSTINQIKYLNNKVDITIGTLAAQYRKRLNLIPDVLMAARESAELQIGYLNKVLEIRKGMNTAKIGIDFSSIDPELIPFTVATFANSGRQVVENNPEINIQAYIKLQNIMKETEDDISAAMRFYCSAVSNYNTKISTFPGSLVAVIHNYKEIPIAQITTILETKPDYYSIKIDNKERKLLL